MKILVTGFDPFGSDKMNPSIQAVKRLPDVISGATIIKCEIPTVFHKCSDVVKEILNKEEVDYILHIGQAGGRFDLTLEKVAINVDDARIPDNENNQPVDETIQKEGATAYFTQLPVKAMVTAIRNAGIPASVSYTAGTFVCNHIMYQSLFLSHTEFKQLKVGFMHVPFLPEQVINRPNQPSMSLENIVSGIQIAIETMIEFDGQEDLNVVGGQTH